MLSSRLLLVIWFISCKVKWVSMLAIVYALLMNHSISRVPGLSMMVLLSYLNCRIRNQQSFGSFISVKLALKYTEYDWHICSTF